MKKKLGLNRKPTTEMIMIKGTLVSPNNVSTIEETDEGVVVYKCLSDIAPTLIKDAKLADVRYVEIGPSGIVKPEPVGGQLGNKESL